jgi:23S rRNA pseudouridine2605 synthase
MAKKTTKTKKTDDLKPASTEPEIAAAPQEIEAAPETAIPDAVVDDPIGDETDGEAAAAIEPAAAIEAEIEPEDSPALENSPELEESSEPDDDEDVPEFTPKPRPPVKLERLQKILAKAGVSSRRKAEELIEQGRVQVNGTVVTELGTKADAGRDHIRVDGKLLQGAERLRYFVLNKPKGFVTTVKDPEGRPTVMQFFDKMRERLYPVGRLDYMSEGLLLVTNDGELANRLTRAAAGVEKTYLVKVAGQPSESELDLLRGGVTIERGKPGSEKVRTSPARIRQVRQGDNPWYEVVLIEGRNRELRKMFEEIGHFVEKIRRVGYGPLILDQEPGNLRELDAADGTLRTPKSKDLRRRNLVDAGKLPTVTPRATGARPAKAFAAKSFEERPAPGPKDYLPKRAFNEGSDAGNDRVRPVRPAEEGTRPRRPAGRDFSSPRHTGGRPSAGPAWQKPGFQKPPFQKDDRAARPPARFDAGSTGESRPAAGKPFGAKPFSDQPSSDKSSGRAFGTKPPAGHPYGDRPATGGRTFGAKPTAGGSFRERPATGKPYGDKPAFNKTGPGKPAWSKPASSDRPAFKRPPAPPRETHDRDEDLGPVRPPNLHIEEIKGSDRPAPSRSSAPRPFTGRTSAPRPYVDHSSAPRSRLERTSAPYSRPDRPGSDRPSRPSAAKPFRGEGGMARPFTTSSGKPRAGGARPNSKPWERSASAGRKPGGRPSESSGPAKRPFRRDTGEGSFTPRPSAGSGPRAAGSRPPGKPGWKPKPSFGGPNKPASGARSKPRPGSAKSSYKGKPGAPKRSGTSRGKKRG